MQLSRSQDDEVGDGTTGVVGESLAFRQAQRRLLMPSLQSSPELSSRPRLAFLTGASTRSRLPTATSVHVPLLSRSWTGSTT